MEEGVSFGPKNATPPQVVIKVRTGAEKKSFHGSLKRNLLLREGIESNPGPVTIGETLEWYRKTCGSLDVSFSAGFTILVFSSGSFLYDRVRTMLSKFSPLSASCKKREMSIQATAAARPDIFNAILSAIVYLWSTSRHQMVTL